MHLAGKPELTGMKLEASVQSTKSPPTIGQKTYKYRQARRRLNDKLQNAIDDMAAVLGGQVSIILLFLNAAEKGNALWKVKGNVIRCFADSAVLN